MTEGTKNYLKSVSIWGEGVEASVAQKNLWVLWKAEEYTVAPGLAGKRKNINYGFPGQSGDFHFNHRVRKMEVIDVKVPGMRKKIV